MRYAVVPRHYLQSTDGAPARVVLWVCALNEGSERLRPPAATLRFEGVETPVTWRYHFNERVYADELVLTVCSERCEASLVVAGAVVAVASVAAPPSTLPGVGERPYTVLVGSCYGVRNDASGRMARAVKTLAAQGALPDVKFLCGDQVYLDTPPDYAWSERPRDELAEKFLGEYRQTWSDGGLLALMREGATYFTADDHEFWNEYPAMRGTDGRTAVWESLARDLFTLFQRRDEPESFAAGAVSFFALDTRLDRSDDLTHFAPPARFEALERWLGALRGPGVLVLGETFFGERGSVGMTLSKALGAVISQPTINGTLQEHAQYAELAALLARSGKTVVLLAGDVHWGRIAECSLPNGTRLVEVVSSPMTLSDSGASRLGRPWTEAPSPFEAAGLSGEVNTLSDATGEPYRPEHDHFCTLEFSTPAEGVGVRLAVRHWGVDVEGPTGAVVYETVL